MSPVSASAETKAGIKPGSFFYFFDTTFEKIGLFFTFNPQKKAEKALEYADERLAEAEAVAEEKNTDAVKTAVAGYESNIALAAEESSQIKDKVKTEELLNSIAGSTSKHQEILSDVLSKVPEEAKEAIIKAIEASKKGQEEATKQIAELKGEIEKLKKEVAELKAKEEAQVKTQSQSQVIEKKESSNTQTTNTQNKNTITTLPSGAVVEMDASGNIIRTIKEAPQQIYIAPAPTTQTQTATTVEISSVNITPTITSAKIEWQTDKPTESKIFLSGGGLSSKIYNSESGFSTKHSVNVGGLKLDSNATYFYEIEAIEAIEAIATNFTIQKGIFKMLSRPYADILNDIKIQVNLNSQLSCYDLSSIRDEILVCQDYRNKLSNSEAIFNQEGTCIGGMVCP